MILLLAATFVLGAWPQAGAMQAPTAVESMHNTMSVGAISDCRDCPGKDVAAAECPLFCLAPCPASSCMAVITDQIPATQPALRTGHARPIPANIRPGIAAPPDPFPPKSDILT